MQLSLTKNCIIQAIETESNKAQSIVGHQIEKWLIIVKMNSGNMTS